MFSTFNADSSNLASVIVLPTDEKSRSNCAVLADMQIRRHANIDKQNKGCKNEVHFEVFLLESNDAIKLT